MNSSQARIEAPQTPVFVAGAPYERREPLLRLPAAAAPAPVSAGHSAIHRRRRTKNRSIPEFLARGTTALLFLFSSTIWLRAVLTGGPALAWLGLALTTALLGCSLWRLMSFFQGAAE